MSVDIDFFQLDEMAMKAHSESLFPGSALFWHAPSQKVQPIMGPYKKRFSELTRSEIEVHRTKLLTQTEYHLNFSEWLLRLMTLHIGELPRKLKKCSDLYSLLLATNYIADISLITQDIRFLNLNLRILEQKWIPKLKPIVKKLETSNQLTKTEELIFRLYYFTERDFKSLQDRLIA